MSHGDIRNEIHITSAGKNEFANADVGRTSAQNSRKNIIKIDAELLSIRNKIYQHSS
jgi:hypothetical protein